MLNRKLESFIPGPRLFRLPFLILFWPELSAAGFDGKAKKPRRMHFAATRDRCATEWNY
jgi:hypothetical protein